MSSACYWYSLYTFLYYQQVVPSSCCLQNPKSIVIGLEPTDVVCLVRAGGVRWYLAFQNLGLCLLTLHLLVAFDAFWILLGGFDGQREFVSPKNSAKQRPFAKKTERHRKIYFCTVYVLWCSVHLSSVWGNMTKKPETPWRLLSGEDAAWTELDVTTTWSIHGPRGGLAGSPI